MPVEYVIYIPLVLFLCTFFFAKAKNKAFVTLFNLWLFGSPIFQNPKYTISISLLGFDIQPNRLLFLVLTPVLFLLIMTPPRMKKQQPGSQPNQFRTFEIVLILFILLMIFTIGVNIQPIGARNVLADITNTVAFIAVYFCSKKLFSREDFDLIKKALLAFALISAIVALYQFFIDPQFFRLGDMRSLFGSYYRSNGLFTAEYDQGIFLTLSMVVVMTTDFKLWMKIGIIAVLCMGGFVTMHRLSWLAILFTLGMIWFLYLRTNLFINIAAPLTLFILVLVAANIPLSRMAIGKFGSSLLTERVMSDTLSIRFSQYDFSFYMMQTYPLGVGDYSNSQYYQEAYNHGLTFVTGAVGSANRDSIAYVIHNGFLSAGVKYGILGLFLYFLFIATAVFDFLGESIRKGKQWYPLLLTISIFAIFNATNDFSFLGTEIGVILAWLLGGYLAVASPVLIGDPKARPIINPTLQSPTIANGN